MPAEAFWRDRRVLVTGHTGFKGSWLVLWLREMGAEVYGYALDPPTSPALFELAGVADALSDEQRSDLRDAEALDRALARARPEVVFHLAGQSLVREGHARPLETFSVNVMGTAHLLDCLRGRDDLRAVVLATSDKCYAPGPWPYPCREIDPLGGQTPYEASKAGAELVATAYRASYFADPPRAARLATARAGNVIGGGDWARDRLVPDCVRAFDAGTAVRLRHPHSIRPWQHVLEPLSGYLRLAECLCSPEGERFATAWNFGPEAGREASVLTVARAMAAAWGPEATVEVDPERSDIAETQVLRIDSTRARDLLGWSPRWPFARVLEETAAWYRIWRDGGDLRRETLAQITRYRDSTA